MRRSLFAGSALAAGLFIACGGLGNAASAPQGARGANSASDLQRLLIKGGALQTTVDPRLSRRRGPVDVWVSLSDPSLAAYKSERLAQLGIEMQTRGAAKEAQGERAAATRVAEKNLQGELQSHRAALLNKQTEVMNALQGLGARELGRVHVAHNAVAVTVDASALPAIANMQGVIKVRPVIHYERWLEETVPYVGAAAVHASGTDGSGVVIAVHDSGVDYTHRNLGGPGTTEAYTAAYGASPDDPKNRMRDGLFPTEKVIEGFDFVGETWGFVGGAEVGERTEDPDPIDAPAVPPTDGGHGTHVADIAAGKSADGEHVGVAPGASLLAVKVCSAISTSCNGVALLEAMDFSLDPDGDGDMGDAADVINMSLGSDYGQIEDDLTEASSNAVKLGVVVVTSAGNGGNKPYIVGSPSIAPGAISVAQTEVPSGAAFPLVINSPPEIAGTYPNTATVDWAPIGDGFTGDVAYVGQGCPADSIEPGSPEDPYLADPAGKVALIDRGACAISLKVDRAAEAGAIGVLIGLIAPGDAVSFSYGGGDDFVPTLVIQQSLSNAIKAHEQAPVNVTVSPESAIDLVGSMVSSSSRGPSMSFTSIKPEIGAPGGSVSAEVATGDGETPFSGTSGAAPMVSGAAALLIEAHPERSPEQIKAMLMNSAETEIFTSPALAPGELAPISRIGAGELRVNRAVELSSVARERTSHSAALSFGFQNVVAVTTLQRTLLVENFGDTAKTFDVTTGFRYGEDEATGAVRLVVAPSSVHVPAHGRKEIRISMQIDGGKLLDWPLDGGPNGGNGALLNGPEYDGYVRLTSGDEVLSVPWHVLPRKSAAITASDSVKAGQKVRVTNNGVAPSGLDVFSLTGISPRASSSELPEPGDSFAFIDLRAVGVRLVTPGVLQFAVNTYGRRAHPNYPAEFDVVIDTNRDGAPDYVVFNFDLEFNAGGSNVVWVFEIAAETFTPVAFTDADLQSGNVILTVPTLAIGITDDTTFDFAVQAIDNYFTGNVTDEVGPMTYTPSTPKFMATDAPDIVPPHSTVRFGTAAVPGGAEASPSQIGLLLMHRLDARHEATIVRME